MFSIARLPSAAFALPLLILAGCARGPEVAPGAADAAPEAAPPAEVVTTQPPRPIDLPAPPVPPKEYNGHDLSQGDAGKMSGFARDLAGQGKYAEAEQFQYWANQAGDQGQYNLACWYAKAGDKEAAFYWLIEAALGDGFDPDDAQSDSDLKALRDDPRWAQVEPFLKRSYLYWPNSGIRRDVLIVPKDYKVGRPIGVVIALHGKGDSAENFADKETYQGIADELDMAVVGVSGTTPTGSRSFVWTEKPGPDAVQIDKALDGFKDRLTVKPGHRIAVGFSSGGQMAFEVAYAYPDQYRGAVVMSPGTRSLDRKLDAIMASPANAGQGYVCLCNAGEMIFTTRRTREDADIARKAGARVVLEVAEGEDEHTLPPGFGEKLAGWVRFVAGTAPAPGGN